MEEPHMMEELELIKYPLPAFLEGRCVPSVFYKWINIKAETLLLRDQKRGKPYAQTATKATYKEKLYEAVIKSGERDPYTGDLFAWELIGTWDTSKPHPEEYKRQFALMPTADHINPDTLEFEMCSWLVNESKSYLSPDEYVALCQKVVNHRVPPPSANTTPSLFDSRMVT
jgi:hypothetical protein